MSLIRNNYKIYFGLSEYNFVFIFLVYTIKSFSCKIIDKFEDSRMSQSVQKSLTFWNI